MKKVIWALFDDGYGSWHNLNQDEYTIISIGINSNDWENYHQIDLRLSNPNLVKQLRMLPPQLL